MGGIGRKRWFLIVTLLILILFKLKYIVLSARQRGPVTNGKGFIINCNRNRPAEKITRHTPKLHSSAFPFIEKKKINFDTGQNVIVGMSSCHGFMV